MDPSRCPGLSTAGWSGAERRPLRSSHRRAAPLTRSSSTSPSPSPARQPPRRTGIFHWCGRKHSPALAQRPELPRRCSLLRARPPPAVACAKRCNLLRWLMGGTLDACRRRASSGKHPPYGTESLGRRTPVRAAKCLMFVVPGGVGSVSKISCLDSLAHSSTANQWPARSPLREVSGQMLPCGALCSAARTQGANLSIHSAHLSLRRCSVSQARFRRTRRSVQS